VIFISKVANFQQRGYYGTMLLTPCTFLPTRQAKLCEKGGTSKENSVQLRVLCGKKTGGRGKKLRASMVKNAFV
jgi:hypothetical protein